MQVEVEVTVENNENQHRDNDLSLPQQTALIPSFPTPFQNFIPISVRVSLSII